MKKTDQPSTNSFPIGLNNEYKFLTRLIERERETYRETYRERERERQKDREKRRNRMYPFNPINSSILTATLRGGNGMIIVARTRRGFNRFNEQKRSEI